MKLWKISRGKSTDRFYLLPRVFVHHIHTSDPQDIYHSHPWNGVSIIFGRYWEEFSTGEGYLRKGINFIRAEKHHRVIINKPVWTLFIHGKKCNKWSIRKYDYVPVRPGSSLFKPKLVSESVEPWRGEKGLKNYEAEAMP